MKGKAEGRSHAGDRVTFEVESLLPSGEGACGRTRIAGAFPGERVVARIDHVGKHATFATSVEVERGRSGRRALPCLRHVDAEDGRCSGCALMALEETDQRTVLREMLLRQHGLEVSEIVAAPESLGYRWSAKRIAFGGPGKLRLGSFVRGTNRPADMRGCLVDHPLIAAAADELAEAAQRLGIAAHDQERKRLGLRAVWLRTNGTQVLATLVTSEANADELIRLSPRLTRCDGLAVSLYRDGGNVLRGAEATVLRGIEELDVLGTAIGPLGFMQPNPKVAERMYDELVDGVGEGRIFDLYAGAGATTRRLRAFAGEVVPCESHPEAARSLRVDPETAEAFLARQTDAPDAVVANPPRKGLGAEVTGELLRLGPARIHVMACGPSGLAKDMRALSKAYRLESLRAYDTLPQTPHVELIAKLVRIEAVLGN
ncbi:MAG: class I SAM-dependent RNA methyltransferase [Gemmatimonadetes bacterium]|nr:class I SAM-dependent RNA methyltransferase [Gemmatimonadota bacterium]